MLELEKENAKDPEHWAKPARRGPRGHDPEQLVLGQLTGDSPAPGVAEDRRDVDRRKRKLWSLIYGGFRPRRRNIRRESDRHWWNLDWHEPRHLYFGIAIFLMSAADALFTMNLIAIGAHETNPFLRPLTNGDPDTFIQVKLSLTAFGVIFLVWAARHQFMGRFPVARLLQVFCAGYVALMIWELYLLVSILGTGLSGSLVPFAAAS